MRLSARFLLSTPLLLASAGSAQVASMMSSTGPSLVIAGAPFQAERVTTTVQHIDDGSVLRREIHELISRDADGRLLVESWEVSKADKHSFLLADPVTHMTAQWSSSKDEGTKQGLASTTHFQVAALEPEYSQRIPTKSDDNIQKMDLGTKNIAGVMCTGSSTTQTVPALTMGNDRPLKRSQEVWTSPDLQMIVAETEISSITGTRTVTTSWLKREAPPSDRFTIPSRVQLKAFSFGGVMGKVPSVRLGTAPTP